MLSEIAETLTRFLQQEHDSPLGLAVLGAASIIEYVFPPFPGDTVTLFGAVLVARHHWSLVAVFVSVMVGSALGAGIDYWIGRRIARRYAAGKLARSARTRAAIERVLEAFRRH